MSDTNYLDRVMGLLHLPQGRIKRAPKNWRTHEGKQKHVMRGLLNEIGVIDAVKVWVPNDKAREALRKAGREGFQAWAASFTGDVALFDGHMRNEEIRQIKSALVTDLDAEEAEKALATFDPVGALAGKDLNLLESLLNGFKMKSKGAADLVDELIGAAKQPKPAEDQSGSAQATFALVVTCKDEEHQVELINRFKREGLKCRALT